MLRLRFRGVTFWEFVSLFRGSETIWNAKANRSFRVDGWIPDHALFGSGRGWANDKRVGSVLDELANDGVIALEAKRWRLCDAIAASAAAAAKAAAKGAASAPGAQP